MAKNIHFIGIGGIGMSALVKFYLSRGYAVTGSDLFASEIIQELIDSGVNISIGEHSPTNLPKNTVRVIFTSAVSTNNPELSQAKELGIPCFNYAQAIGELTNEYKTITVSGSHGKSTTTALAALVLEAGYFDPTVIVGTKVMEFENSNFRRGRGNYFVLEADEWNKSFLNYSPKIAIITNIDAEHLDTYKDLAGVKKTFEEYLSKVPSDGKIIANADDQNLSEVAVKFGSKVRWFSKSEPETERIASILKIPGEHNLSNALAAHSLGRFMGISEGHILQAIASFTGVWRRFEFKGISTNGAYVFNDYGHHPTEIKATILAARQRFPMRRIWCLFQPHQHQRLAFLWNDFIASFDQADRITILPVFEVKGREKTIDENISSENLVEELRNRGKVADFCHSIQEMPDIIKKYERRGDIIIIMGAGDLYTKTPEVLK